MILFLGSTSLPTQKQFQNDIQITRVIMKEPKSANVVTVKRESEVSALPFTSQQISHISNSLTNKMEKTELMATGNDYLLYYLSNTLYLPSIFMTYQ